MYEAYVHGYDSRESSRLRDQASTLVDLLHGDSLYPAGSAILEAGCGVGAQTVAIAAKNPAATITAVDISRSSLADAERATRDAGLTNVTFRQADVFALPFATASFDHAIVCFVLEHLARPVEALRTIARAVKPGGTIAVIEGDHGSAYFHPDSARARAAIAAQVRLQADAGGNALIGRALYPLLARAGLVDVTVTPKLVYVDGETPELAVGFTKRTFTAMIAGVRERAIAGGLVAAADFDGGIADLERTAQSDGVFCYTFFKAWARVPELGLSEEGTEPFRRSRS